MFVNQERCTRLLKLALVSMALGGLACTPPVRAFTDQLEINGVQLNVRWDASIDQQQDPARWNEWLSRSLQAAQSIGNHYPQTQLDVYLISASGDQPVSFGRVRRSVPPQVHFYLNPDASLDQLLDDWHSYHEFAHLLIPFPGNRDIWFSEGLASYYQYLLQARAGVIDVDEAWLRLIAGFERGLNDQNGKGRDLRELSPAMWHAQAYRRVYWTGAAFFLRIDTRLRMEASGQYSLDQVLADFNQCCRQDRRRWTAEQLISEFGRLSMPQIWREEYRASIDAPAEPMVSSAFEQLGIFQQAESVQLRSDQQAEALRNAIALGHEHLPFVLNTDDCQ